MKLEPFLLLVFWCTLSNGQIINGTLTSENNDSISFAQIELLSMPNGETKNIVYSDQKGYFEIPMQNNKDYHRLRITSFGYQTLETDSFLGTKQFNTVQLKKMII